MSLKKHTTRRSPQMEKYVHIVRVVGSKPPRYRVMLSVSNQMFTINDGDYVLSQAKWMRDMLCIALAGVRRNVVGGHKP